MAFLEGKEDDKILDSEISDGEEIQKKRGNKEKPRVKKKAEEGGDSASGDTDDVGVVYLSHIPHGFYEPQMKHFFGQFGTVTRLKLFRSKKSGKSRGFAYIEFEYADVAKIVADTMNNYLMFQKLLKCKFIPRDELCSGAFANADRLFVRPYHRKASMKRHNSLLEAEPAHILKNQKRLVQKEGKRKQKMEKLGISFSPPGYVEEWQNIKKARAVTMAIEKMKQEALKRAKEKARRQNRNQKRAKKQRKREEREKAKAEQSQESTDEKTQGGDEAGKSPKRKSSESQDPSVSSASKGVGQPRKKKGRLSTPDTPDKNSSPEKDEEEKASSVGRRRSNRLSTKGRQKLAWSVADRLKTPKKTLTTTAARRSRVATLTSEVKILAKKTSSTPKTPAQRQKELRKPRNRQDLQRETTTPQSGSKIKLPETGSSSNDLESDDTSEEEVKINEFKGIKLTALDKKEENNKKSGKIEKQISIHGDQLLLF